MGGGISPRMTRRDINTSFNSNNSNNNLDNNNSNNNHSTSSNSPRSTSDDHHHGSKPRKKKEIVQISNPEISPRLSNYHGKFSMQSLANTAHNLKIFNNGAISPDKGIYLTCDAHGNLCGSEIENNSDDAVDSWKVLYLDMKWPQQYFHLLNIERKRIVRAEMSRYNNEDSASKPTLPSQSSSSSATLLPVNNSVNNNIVDSSQDSVGSNNNNNTTLEIKPQEAVTSTDSNDNHNKAKLITITIEDSENNPELRDTKLLFYLSRSQQHSGYYIINTTFGMCLSHDAKGIVSLQSVPEVDRSDCLWHFRESL